MPTTAEIVATLRAHADEVEAQIAAIRAEYDEKVSPLLRELNETREILGRLTPKHRSDYNSKMLATARLQHSKARAHTRLVQACDDAGLTLRMLASDVECSQPLLTQAHAGDRSISYELAKRIELRLGADAKGRPRFAATKANWPRLRSE
jgi:hypothetical protein